MGEMWHFHMFYDNIKSDNLFYKSNWKWIELLVTESNICRLLGGLVPVTCRSSSHNDFQGHWFFLLIFQENNGNFDIVINYIIYKVSYARRNHEFERTTHENKMFVSFDLLPFCHIPEC